MKNQREGYLDNIEVLGNEYMDLVGKVVVKEKALKIREANCRALEMVHDKKEVTRV